MKLFWIRNLWFKISTLVTVTTMVLIWRQQGADLKMNYGCKCMPRVIVDLGKLRNIKKYVIDDIWKNAELNI